MKPINVAERRSTFFIFLLFFVLSSSLVVLTAFFGMKVPSKENELMKGQVNAFEKEEGFKQKFANQLAVTRGMFEKRKKSSLSDAMRMDHSIRANIDTLDSYVVGDTPAHMEMYHNVVSSLYELWDANQGLSQKGNDDENVRDLRQELSMEKQNSRSLQQQLNEANARLASSGR